MRKNSVLIISIVFVTLATVCFAGLTGSQRQALTDIANGGTGIGWTDLTLAQKQELKSSANLYLSTYYSYHIPNGLNADVWFVNFNRTAVVTYPNPGYLGLGDSATFTGMYLAALALKYANTTDESERLVLLVRINSVLDMFGVLIHVSGKTGFLARHAVIMSVPADGKVPDQYLQYYSTYDHFKNRTSSNPNLGPDAFVGATGYTNYAWLGASERDTYVGVNFGLAAVLAKINDQNTRNKVKNIIHAIIQDLTASDWYIRDGKSGGFLNVNLYRVSVTSTLKAALLRTAATADPTLYRSDYISAANNAPSLNTLNSSEYYANTLEFDLMYALNVLEAMDTTTSFDSKWLGRLQNDWNQAATHLNAYFAGVYLACTQNTSDAKAVATLLGELADFPSAPRWWRETLSSISSSTASHVLNREIDDFLWEREPFNIVTLGNAISVEYPGIDVFLPYWLACEARLTDYCGQQGTVYLNADMDHDCYVNFVDLKMLADKWLIDYSFYDFASFSAQWLNCTDPAN